MKTTVAAVVCAVAGLLFAIGYNAYLFGWVGQPESTLLANLPKPQEVEPILEQGPRARRGNPKQNAGKMLPLPPANGPQPKAVVGDASYDFGTMLGGDKGRHEFVLKNEGDYPLQLAKGKTSCKCTISDLPVTKLEPGEETKILVTWKTSSSRSGKFRQSARILTNDPKQQTLTLTVAGEITVLLRSVPSYVTFGRMTPKESKTVEFKLHSYHLVIAQLEVEDFEFEHPETAKYFDVSFESLPQDQLDKNSTSGLIGKLTLKGDREGMPPFPSGTIRQTLRVKTNVREVDTIPLTVGGTVVREIDISSRGWNAINGRLDLYLLSDTAKERIPLNVWVRGPQWQDVVVELESVTPDWLKVTKTKTESRAASKAQHVVFEIAVDKDAEAAYYKNPDAAKSGKIVLKSTHSTLKQIDIPIQLAPDTPAPSPVESRSPAEPQPSAETPPTPEKEEKSDTDVSK